MSCLLANLLYAAALSYYHYMTFLGYSALPFLTNTELFLYPIGAIGVVLPFAIMFGFNPSRCVSSLTCLPSSQPPHPALQRAELT